MERLDRNISALQSALEKRPKVFEAIGVNLPINILLSVVDDLVLVVVPLESLIGHEVVGIDRAACFDMRFNFGVKDLATASWNHIGVNLATALQDTEHRDLVAHSVVHNNAVALVVVHEARSTANESLI